MSLARIKRHCSSVSVITGQKWFYAGGQQRTEKEAVIQFFYINCIFTPIVIDKFKK
jgi:hypothetical protein